MSIPSSKTIWMLSTVMPVRWVSPLGPYAVTGEPQAQADPAVPDVRLDRQRRAAADEVGRPVARRDVEPGRDGAAVRAAPSASPSAS